MIMFTRGLDPKRAMGTGVITWDNLNEGCYLRAKKTVYLNNPLDRELLSRIIQYRFCRDRAYVHADIMYNSYILIKEIEIVKNQIKIKWKPYRSEDCYYLKGPLDLYRKYFEIIQPTNNP